NSGRLEYRREKNKITTKTMIKITKISSIFSVRQRIKLSNRFLYEAIVTYENRGRLENLV
ncbi:MAG TPA: hypothetical protein VFF49_11635, partial [Thermodesulfobacteriota bacterium]|nr:hypothetical protein [Thermodesulfobacteriota bacterium]